MKTELSADQDELDRLSVTTLRMLAIDAIEQARSGHPGLPLGAAPMAYVLWKRIMRHNPADPRWPDRDRFILSAGHGSALLYALLHLTGYDMPLEEIKNFRQWGSLTPGHPEYGHTAGVEATTGPLGQGFAMGVGMAIAERQLAQSTNHHDFLPVVDHSIYAIVSDGDLMEGIASEAASLAGNLCLGKLIYLYDDNKISIEGDTAITFSENVAKRFEAYEWQVLRVEDGEDLDAIEEAVRRAQADEERPSLIIVRTHIGYGSPAADTSGAHGSPIVGEAMVKTREFYHWPEERFHIPIEAMESFRAVEKRGRELNEEWNARISVLQSRFPDLVEKFQAQIRGAFPENWDAELKALEFDGAIPTRSASGKCINALAPNLPALVGGSADLAPSNNTWINGDENEERNFHYGVREHAMAAITNGIALHGGYIPYCGTFMAFSDYMRGAIRLSALMGLHAIYVLTHDSIAVGEDGPTHQPIEHLASLRAMPELLVIRPSDAYETAQAWGLAVEMGHPVALVLSREKLPLLPRVEGSVAKGAYVLSDCDGTPDVILIGTGGETHLNMEAQKELAAKGVKARVVSMPCWKFFLSQKPSYRESVLPPEVKARVSVEAGSSMGWHRWVGDGGECIAVDRFGTSAPGGEVLREYGFSVDNVVRTALKVIKRNGGTVSLSAESLKSGSGADSSLSAQGGTELESVKKETKNRKKKKKKKKKKK